MITFASDLFCLILYIISALIQITFASGEFFMIKLTKYSIRKEYIRYQIIGVIICLSKKNNLDALQRRFPEIYNKIKNIQPNQRFQIKAVPGKQNIPNLLDTVANKLFYDNKDPPMQTAIKNVLSKNIKLPFFNIFLGSGLMYNFFAFFQSI